MTDGFFADVERIAARSKDFDDHATRAKRVAESLDSTLESTGRAWGGDAVGERFDAAHGEAANQARELLSALGGELGELGAKFAGVAETYRASEASGLSDVQSVDRRLGNS